MITRNDLAVFKSCIETLLQNGKIAPDAMLTVGIAYENLKKAIEKMQEGDVLVVFTPSKKNEKPELPEHGDQEAKEEQKPKESKKRAN